MPFDVRGMDDKVLVMEISTSISTPIADGHFELDRADIEGEYLVTVLPLNVILKIPSIFYRSRTDRAVLAVYQGSHFQRVSASTGDERGMA